MTTCHGTGLTRCPPALPTWCRKPTRKLTLTAESAPTHGTTQAMLAALALAPSAFAHDYRADAAIGIRQARVAHVLGSGILDGMIDRVGATRERR